MRATACAAIPSSAPSGPGKGPPRTPSPSSTKREGVPTKSRRAAQQPAPQLASPVLRFRGDKDVTLRLHNSLTGTKDVFEPLEDSHVRMYTCGPTVWNFAHIGNLRACLFYDLLPRR